MNSIFLFLLSLLVIYSASDQSHPLNFSLALLVLSSLTGVTLMQSINLWLGLSLILIFLGGMMVIILYVSSLASENKFNLSSQNFLIFMGTVILCPHFLSPVTCYSSTKSLISLYLNFSSFTLLFLLVYLLLVLIVVVFISESYHGPVGSWN